MLSLPARSMAVSFLSQPRERRLKVHKAQSDSIDKEGKLDFITEKFPAHDQVIADQGACAMAPEGRLDYLHMGGSLQKVTTSE